MLRLSAHARRLLWTIHLAVVTTIAACGVMPAVGQTGVINPLNYAGANLCAKIQTAIAANAAANPQGRHEVPGHELIRGRWHGQILRA